jgi:TM2 domain-containing membrane protein YozV
MKKTIFIIGLLFAFLSANFGFAASMNPNFASGKSAPVDNLTAAQAKNLEKEERKALKEQQKIEKKANKLAKLLEKAKRAGDNQILAIILCLFLGGLGLHRLVMGSKPILILGYILLSILLIGWIVVLIDLIRLIINPGHYSGNNKLFAAFM